MKRTKTQTLLTLLLAAVASFAYANHRERTAGVDFYANWAAAAAQRSAGQSLGSPYINLDGYADIHRTMVMQHPDDEPLFLATAFWYNSAAGRSWLPLQTPLIFTSFTLFPSDFSFAFALYRWSAWLLFIFALALWGSLSPSLAGWMPASAFILLLSFFPVQRDLGVGNVGVFLLAGLVSALVLVHRIKRLSAGHAVVFQAVLATWLTFLTLFKPLVLLPCLLVGLYVLVTGTSRERVAFLLASTASLALCLLVSSWFFGSWTVWLDWFDYLAVRKHMVFPSSSFNCSLVIILVERFGTNPLVFSAAIGGVLIGSLLVVFRSRVLTARSLFGDPVQLASLSILATLAVSPLVWHHYYVLAVLPALWLFSRRDGSLLITGLVLVAWLANTPLIVNWLLAQSHSDGALMLQSVSWVPLWIGSLLVLGLDSGAAAGAPHRYGSARKDILSRLA